MFFNRTINSLCLQPGFSWYCSYGYTAQHNLEDSLVFNFVFMCFIVCAVVFHFIVCFLAGWACMLLMWLHVRLPTCFGWMPLHTVISQYTAQSPATMQCVTKGEETTPTRLLTKRGWRIFCVGSVPLNPAHFHLPRKHFQWSARAFIGWNRICRHLRNWTWPWVVNIYIYIYIQLYIHISSHGQK